MGNPTPSKLGSKACKAGTQGHSISLASLYVKDCEDLQCGLWKNEEM